MVLVCIYALCWSKASATCLLSTFLNIFFSFYGENEKQKMLILIHLLSIYLVTARMWQQDKAAKLSPKINGLVGVFGGLKKKFLAGSLHSSSLILQRSASFLLALNQLVIAYSQCFFLVLRV